MLFSVLSLLLIVSVGLFAMIRGPLIRKIHLSSKVRFYQLLNLQDLALVLLLFILYPSAVLYFPSELSGDNFKVIEPLLLYSTLPVYFVMTIIRFPKSAFLISVSDKQYMGLPARFMPDTYKELSFFALMIVIGVVSEELIFRRILINHLYAITGLDGQALIVLAAFIFSWGHSYQGGVGIVSSFILGILLGNLYMEQGQLLPVILLHLIINVSILIIAYRRIRLILSGKLT